MSRVFTLKAPQSTMGPIADGGLMPITKQQTKNTGTDARQWARDLVCTAFEQDATHGEVQKSRTLTVARGTVDGRAAVIEEARMQIDMLAKANDPRVASLRTTASVLTTIAKAFNAGASEDGLVAAYSDKGLSLDDMTQKHIVDYCRLFLQSVGEGSAKGRPVHGVLSRLDSMLKDCTDKKVFDKLTADDKVILKRLQDFRAQFE